MIKNFIWDFDGMLFDTYPHTAAAFVETYSRHGIELEKAEVFENLKISITHAFKVYNTSEETVKEFYEIENDLSFKPIGVPYEKIPETLKLIYEHGGRNFLYTHRDKVAVQYLEIYGLKEYFTDFITRENGFPLKPNPMAIDNLVKKHSLKCQETMMFGDRIIDIEAGKNAGVKACLFDEFKKFSPDFSDWYFNFTQDIFAKIKDEIK